MEFCSKGDLKHYLIEHAGEFKQSLQYYHEHGVQEQTPLVASDTPHDIEMLFKWISQVYQRCKRLHTKIRERELYLMCLCVKSNLYVFISTN